MGSASVSRSEERGRGTLLAAVIATWIALHLFALQRHAPPAPRGAEAPADVFSAARARAFLEALVVEQEPRPMGSAAAARVRARLVAELEQLGLEVALEQRFVCGPYGSCGTPVNVIGRIRAASDGPVVLLVAHYDSVVAGPGIGDDLSSVAALLEVARALRTDGPPRRTVELLFTDGEELGLLGAAAYAAKRDPADIAAVLNLEARGTSGPSMLFETGPRSGPLVEAYGRAVRRPAAMSISQEVYSRMPNDTDFSVFRKLGVAGLNFAFIGGWQRYHTRLDRMELLDWGSIQHQGEGALAVARALALDRLPEAAGELVYADVLGYGLLRWPTTWGAPLAALVIAALLVRVRTGLRRGQLARRALLRGALGSGLGIVAAGGLGIGLHAVLRGLAGHAFPAAAAPAYPLIAWWCAAGLALLFASRRSSGGAAERAAEAWGGWLAWALLGLGASVWLPGAGYLFLLPLSPVALAALVGRAPASLRMVAVATVSAWLVAVLFWSPLQIGFEAALRRGPSWATTVPVACVGSLLLPVLSVLDARARRWLTRALIAVLVLASAMALRGPHQSPALPAPLNFAHVDHATGIVGSGAESQRKAWWEASALVGLDLPPEVRAAFNFDLEPHEPAAWNRIPTYRTAAPGSGIPGPGFEVSEELDVHVGRRIRAHVRPGGSAAATVLAFDGIVKAKVNGLDVEQEPAADQTVVYLLGLGPEGVEVELWRESREPLIGFLVDQYDGLPGPGADPELAAQEAKLESARPPDRVPIGPGDQTLVVQPFRF